MTEESSTQEQRNPLTKPWFIGGAVVVGLIVLAGIIVAATGGDEPDNDPTAAPAASPSASEQAPAGDASMCGLPGVEMSGRVTTAPEVTSWEYQDVFAYPVSATAGPGEVDETGYRYCFQHTPTGALFAAANAAIMGFATDHALMDGWREYAYSNGTYRSELLAKGNGVESNREASGIRASIAGFKLLAYDGNTARVDIVITGSQGANTATGSNVFDLVWSEGDWKINTEVREPTRLTQIPSTAGYVSWREGGTAG
jgi:hypothetical protein